MPTRFLLALVALLTCPVVLAAEPAPPASVPVAAAPGSSDDAPPQAAGPLAPADTSTPEAASTAPAPSPLEPLAPADAALRGPLLLQAEGFEDRTAVEELRGALSAEFGCLVLLGAEESRFSPTGRLVVARHPDTQELAVTFVDAAERSATRVVQEPADPAERTRMVTLLAGTLARSPVETDPGETPTVEAPVVLAPPPSPEPLPPMQPAVAALFYPLATNFDQPDVHTYFAFSLLYGRIGSLDGLGVGMLQFASRQVQGAQFAFLGNAAGGSVAGVQAALGVNSAGTLSGLQAAAVNQSAGDVNGAQLGFLNYAGGRVTGAQGGLSINIAGDVHGGQVGFVNLAKRVKGVQVGLINVADEVDGVPIGLISVTKDGGVHPFVWYSNVTPFNSGVRFATKYTYTFLNASWDPDSSMIGPGGGIGGSVPIFLDNLFVDIDVGGAYLFKDSGPADDGRSLARLRGTVRYQILPHLSVFAGGGYTGKVEREAGIQGALGDFYYQSLGEFIAGIGL